MVKKRLNNQFKIAFKECEARGIIKSKKEAAITLGLSPQLLSEILNDRINAGAEVLHNFCSAYSVRLEYIFYGEAPVFEFEKHLLMTEVSGTGSNADLKGLSKVTIVNNPGGMEGFVKPGLNSTTTTGSADYFYLPDWYKLNTELFAFVCHEANMYPSIPDRSLVVCSKIANNLPFVNGQVYAINHKNLGFIIRRVKWFERQNHMVQLISDNHEFETIVTSTLEIEHAYLAIYLIQWDIPKPYRYKDPDFTSLMSKIKAVTQPEA
jgi:transcriptional regulator with XRE-family HTH domain